MSSTQESSVLENSQQSSVEITTTLIKDTPMDDDQKDETCENLEENELEDGTGKDNCEGETVIPNEVTENNNLFQLQTR